MQSDYDNLSKRSIYLRFRNEMKSKKVFRILFYIGVSMMLTGIMLRYDGINIKAMNQSNVDPIFDSDLDKDNDSIDPDPDLQKHKVDYDYESGLSGVSISANAHISSVKSPFTKSTYCHAKRFKGYRVLNGIDISEWQGNINWKKVKRSGVEYAIIRIGYRGSDSGAIREDRRYLKNIKGALKAGIKVGVYIYSQAISPAEAKAEANYLLRRIKGYNISMPVVLDYEFYTSSSGRLYNAHLTRREATDVCKAFCKTVENAGYTPMVYGNSDMLGNHLYGEEIAKDYDVWLANFGKNDGTDRNFATAYNGTYSFWQYTSRGKVPGIHGAVDCNFWYKANNVATGIQITDSDVTLKSDNMLYLYHSLSPSGCTDSIVWSSSKPQVAYVKDGYVYGVSAGETTITATTSTGASDSCKVFVSENMNNYKISGAGYYDYTGEEITPEIEVISQKEMATEGKIKKAAPVYAGPGTDYRVVKNVNKGNEVTIYGKANGYYAVRVKVKGKYYSGYCKTSYIKSKKVYKKLNFGTDYMVKYSSDVDAGSALVEVTGASDSTYSGTISKVYTINKKALSNNMLISISNQSDHGGEVKPVPRLYYRGKALQPDKDFKVAYRNNQYQPGDLATVATATITGVGNFSGSLEAEFTIADSSIQSVEEVPEQSYTGAAICPDLKVKGKNGDLLQKGVDYTVTYSNNVNPGTASASIQLNGQQTQRYCVYFPIISKDVSVLNVQPEGSYYYNKETQKCRLSVTDGSNVLTEGVDYTCQYFEHCCAGQAKVRITGIGNYAGTKEVCYDILPALSDRLKIEKVTAQAYTGKKIIPQITVKDGADTLVKGKDYKVSCTKNKKVGTAQLTVTGIGNYSGQKSVQFQIKKQSVTACKITKIGNRKHTGKKIKPKVTIRNAGKKLKKGRDYTVSYGKNRAVGKATVTIKGKGNYTGKKKISFRIVR